MVTTIVPFDQYDHTKLCLQYCEMLKIGDPLEIIFFDSGDENADSDDFKELVENSNDTVFYRVKGNAADELTELTALKAPSIIIHAIGNSGKPSRVPDVDTACKYILQLKQNFLLLPHDYIPKPIKKIVFPVHTLAKVRHKVSLTAKIARMSNAEIHVVSIISSTNKKNEKRTILYGNQVFNHFRSLGIPTVQETIFNKELVKAIADYTAQMNADLISIIPETTHGPSFFTKSYIHEVMKALQHPMLIIAPRKSKLTGSFKTSG